MTEPAPTAGSPVLSTEKVRQAPGPRNRFLFSSAAEMKRKGLLKFYYDAWVEYGDLTRFQFGPMTMHNIVRSEHVQHVLVKNPTNYHKGASLDKLRLALGSGVFTAEGPLWQRQRRLMSPSYTPKAVTTYAEIMTGSTRQMLERWQSYVGRDELLKINGEMMRLTMTIISQSMFGIDIGESSVEAGPALRFILEFATSRTMSFIDPPLWVPTPLHRRFKHAMNVIDTLVYGIIEERQADPDPNYLLTMLMKSIDEETGEVMDKKQIRDEALITFFAGHETTAQLLTWTWYMLAKNPEVEARLHAELASVLGGRTPDAQDIPSLIYTRQVIDETLRLYSPVAVTARDVIADDEIDGFHIPAGSMVMISPYLTHRHPEYWSNPEKFDPDHFLPDQVAARPRYAYYPFGAGQRICLGMHFALLEGVLVLAEAAQRYRLRLVPGEEVHPVMVGTLRPDHDIRMTLESR